MRDNSTVVHHGDKICAVGGCDVEIEKIQKMHICAVGGCDVEIEKMHGNCRGCDLQHREQSSRW